MTRDRLVERDHVPGWLARDYFGHAQCKASQCQAPEACSALRKNATPMASDGALRLGSTQIIKNPMASLSKGLLVEKNYKGIGHVRHHWLVAVDPQCWLFGYEAGGKVVYVEPNDYGAWPTYAELPSEIAGSGESKNRQLFTVLKRGTMAMLFSPLGKTGTLQGVLGDSSPLSAGTPLTPCRPSCAPVLSFAGPRQLLPSPRATFPLSPTTPPHRIPTHPDCAAGGGYTWPSVSAHMRTTERAVVVSEVPRPFLPPPCRPACSSSAALQRGLVS